MAAIEKTVFISYRRSNIAWALAIYQDLTYHEYNVFFDFKSIPSGDFESAILENVRSRAHFLVLLTPSALERCSDPDDWLRREIEEAMASRRNIIPLMLDSFDFGAPGIAARLTGNLAPLRRYNGLTVPVGYFDDAMVRLRRTFLNVALDAVTHPPSDVARNLAAEQQSAANDAQAVKPEDMTADIWVERARAAVHAPEQIRCWSEVIRLMPDNAHAYHRRASARESVADLPGAMQDLDELVRIRPSDDVAHTNRASIRERLGDVRGALEDYREAIRLRPDNFGYRSRRNSLRENYELHPATTQDLDDSIRTNPSDPSAHADRAHIRERLGDTAGALQDLDNSIQLDPDNSATRASRACLRNRLGNTLGALEDSDEVIRIAPTCQVP